IPLTARTNCASFSASPASGLFFCMRSTPVPTTGPSSKSAGRPSTSCGSASLPGMRCSRPAARLRPTPPRRTTSRTSSTPPPPPATTGPPKAVPLPHHTLVNNGLMIAQALRATADDRLCVPVPMYHCFGCVIGSMVSVVTGAAMILPAPQFDARATLEAIERERATALYGVPTMFIAQLEHPDFERFDLRSLRSGIMAGAPCPIEVMRKVCNRMHCREITIAYGQTEASPVITMSAVDDSLETRVTTIGAALPNTEVRIADTTSGETLPVGSTGELCTRGYLVMKGYDEDPDATTAAIDREGWLHTGDLASMDANGYFTFRGRARD